MLKQFFQKIPKLPLSALIFYICIVILWKFDYIPSPSNILLFLENLYILYGLIGLFIASFLEGIVYFGLYFPGSFIVALAVILSDGTFKSLFFISLVVAIALTITSLINYILGRKILANRLNKELLGESKKIFSKFFFASFLHPNILAFYFFNSGIKKQNFLKILLVPLIMIPYGLVLGYFFYSIKKFLKIVIESPYIMISVILFWILIVFFLENKKKIKIKILLLKFFQFIKL
jgi:membrane protein DedA with SNARE-associated domain